MVECPYKKICENNDRERTFMKKSIFYSIAFILAFFLFGAVGEIMRVEHGWSEMQGGILMLIGAMCVIGLYIVSTRRK